MSQLSGENLMKTVSVKATNLKVGDILNGSRISHKVRFGRRCRANDCDKDALQGVLVVMPHPKGYDVITRKFVGSERVKVKRPACNMR
jgi:hypothetical protein